MTTSVVVDIGNSRMKWGRLIHGSFAECVSLKNDDPINWKRTFNAWSPLTHDWLVASVVPEATQRFQDWLNTRSMNCLVLDNGTLLENAGDFRTKVESPDLIGIDRLLNAFAAFERVERNRAVAVISVGTAMTVDFITELGTHVGGAIMPGPHLMAQSLKDNTAKLPLVDLDFYSPETVWGENTERAIELGIVSAIQGAADQLIWEWAKKVNVMSVFITGGDRRFFQGFEFTAAPVEVVIDEVLTLDGLRRIAGKLP